MGKYWVGTVENGINMEEKDLKDQTDDGGVALTECHTFITFVQSGRLKMLRDPAQCHQQLLKSSNKLEMVRTLKFRSSSAPTTTSTFPCFKAGGRK